MELPDKAEKELISDYKKSKKRLLLLDYDGTLVPFFDRPEDAKPDGKILKLLEKLAEDPKNEVVLISGRGRANIEEWFDVDMSFVAGHGVWIKEKGKDWGELKDFSAEWKSDVRPIFEKYTDETPGSIIEEKEFSLGWHYRGIDPELMITRPRELVKELKFIGSLNLQMMNVNQIIEVMNAGVNKGEAALRWIDREDWEFILAIGDDWTDEDTFRVLPKTAYSIKVGARPTQARFSLDSFPFVIWLLKELMRE